MITKEYFDINYNTDNKTRRARFVFDLRNEDKKTRKDISKRMAYWSNPLKNYLEERERLNPRKYPLQEFDFYSIDRGLLLYKSLFSTKLKIVVYASRDVKDNELLDAEGLEYFLKTGERKAMNISGEEQRG